MRIILKSVNACVKRDRLEFTCNCVKIPVNSTLSVTSLPDQSKPRICIRLWKQWRMALLIAFDGCLSYDNLKTQDSVHTRAHVYDNNVRGGAGQLRSERVAAMLGFVAISRDTTRPWRLDGRCVVKSGQCCRDGTAASPRVCIAFLPVPFCAARGVHSAAKFYTGLNWNIIFFYTG